MHLLVAATAALTCFLELNDGGVYATLWGRQRIEPHRLPVT